MMKIKLATAATTTRKLENLSSQNKLLLLLLTITTSIFTLSSLQNSIQHDTSASLTSPSFVPVTNLRHPATTKQKLQNNNDNTIRTMADLRYLTLGSSITYGAGLANRYSAFPYLLSPNPTKLVNIAVKNNNMDSTTSSLLDLYPSGECLQRSIVQHSQDGNGEEFDVILIQHDVLNYDGLYELTKILRMRYPDAIILLVCIWTPKHFHVYQDNQNKGTLYDWASSQQQHHQQQQQQHNNNVLPFYDFISSQHIQNIEVKWFNPKPLQRLHQKIQSEWNAHLFFFANTENTLFQTDPKEVLRKYKHYFQNDYMHLNDFGHQQVVRGLQEMIHEVAHGDDGSSVLLEKPRVGTWMEEDGGFDNNKNGGYGHCPSLSLNQVVR